MFSILQTINGILRGSTVNILGLNPDLRTIRVRARDFADEFWDDVIEDTGGDDSAMSALYATLALWSKRRSSIRWLSICSTATISARIPGLPFPF